MINPIIIIKYILSLINPIVEAKINFKDDLLPLNKKEIINNINDTLTEIKMPI